MGPYRAQGLGIEGLGVEVLVFRTFRLTPLGSYGLGSGNRVWSVGARAF